MQYCDACYTNIFVLLVLVLFLMSGVTTSKKCTIVLGAGIHGASVAYNLSLKGVAPIIIEGSSIAAAASGKSGGFLARDWGSGPTVQLHEKSFDLHRQLAAELNIQSFREVKTLSVSGGRRGKNAASWLDRDVASSLMGGSTAQVTPKELTEKLVEAAVDRGATLITGDQAVGIDLMDNRIAGVTLASGKRIGADVVVVCLGPWSGVFCEDHFGVSLPVTGIKSTSLIFRDVSHLKTEPYACFCEEDKNGCHLEMYARYAEELYVCGCGGSDYVRDDRLRPGGDCDKPDKVHADPARVQAALRSLRGLSSIGDAEPDVMQSCMRPCTPDGLPIMGELAHITGAYVSFGHNCWGILWAPASGLAMAELIVEGRSKSIDISPFTPARFSGATKQDISQILPQGAVNTVAINCVHGYPSGEPSVDYFSQYDAKNDRDKSDLW